MSRRLTPLAALAACALVACPAPTATTLAAKQQKVDLLTGALSYQSNEHLKEAADSLGQVNTNLSAPGFKRAEGAVGNIVAQGGGNIVAQGGGNIISTNGGGIISTNGGGIISTNGGGLVALGRAIASLGLKVPALAAPPRRLAQTADVQIQVDPASGELQRVWNADASLGFQYKTAGNRHQETITLDGLPDGTKASLLLDFTSPSWRYTAPPPEVSFDRYYGNGRPAFDPNAPYDPYNPYDPTYYHTAQASGVTFMGNEAPIDPQAAAVAIKLLPKGATANQLHAEFAFDTMKLLNGSTPSATHYTFGFGMPSIDVDGEMRLTSASTGSLKGHFSLEPKPGAKEAFTYQLTAETSGKAEFLLEHAASQVRLRISSQTNARTGEAITDMALYAMEDNSKIADITPTPGDPNTITLSYIDGTVKRWAPFSGAPAILVSGPTGAPTPGTTARATATPAPQVSYPAHF
ncbi:MAG: hypothetical protein JWM80_1205 [Cyanobacteria bacterium RYN_339]|nr:hypothetical protein [Cyanobacteria bacterium RYN_339]